MHLNLKKFSGDICCQLLNFERPSTHVEPALLLLKYIDDFQSRLCQQSRGRGIKPLRMIDMRNLAGVGGGQIVRCVCVFCCFSKGPCGVVGLDAPMIFEFACCDVVV